MDLNKLLNLAQGDHLDDLISYIKQVNAQELTEDYFTELFKVSEKLRLKGDINAAFEILDTIEPQVNKFSLVQIKIAHAIQKIYCLWRLFDNYSALHLSILTLELLEEEQNANPKYEEQLAFLHHLRGNIFAALGEYSLAIKTQKISLDIYKKLGISEKVALLSNNIGFNVSLVGETHESEKYLTQALNYYKDMDSYQDTARVLNNLGMLKYQTGDFDESEKLYKEALRLQNLDPNSHELSYSYLESIKLFIMKEDMEQAHHFLRKFQEIAEDNTYEIIKLRYNMAKAIVFKEHNRFESKAKAVNILKNILSSETLHHRYAITALKYLAEIKFEELEIFEDLAILEEIEEVISRLLEEGALQESIIAKAETDLLLSKVYLIKGEFELALKCLYKAQSNAEDNGLKHLAMNISNLYDELLDQLSFWESRDFRKESITQRMMKANVFNFLRNIQRNRFDAKVTETEESVMFLILDDFGKIKATVKFDYAQDLQEYLIGNLITAISTFFTSTFAESDRIERIKSKEFTLVLKSDGQFTYCYICKGQSYYAIKKLNNLVIKLHEMAEFQTLMKKWNGVQDLVFNLPLKVINTIENTLTQEFY